MCKPCILEAAKKAEWVRKRTMQALVGSQAQLYRDNSTSGPQLPKSLQWGFSHVYCL